MEFFLYFVLAIGVGLWATTKGQSGIGWTLVSLFITPLLGVMLFLFFSFKEKEEEQSKINADKQAMVMEKNRIFEEAEAELKRSTISAIDFVAEIQKFFNLKQNGLLSEDEFSELKKNIIQKLLTKKPRESSSDFLSAMIPLVKCEALTSADISEIKKCIFIDF